MSIDVTTIRESNARDRRAMYVGTVVTGVATLVLFVLPDLIPLAALKQWYFERTGSIVRGNPFTPVRMLGGLIGGGVAGWLTSDLGSGAVTGLTAALLGLVLAYLLAVAYYVLYSALVVGVFPPAMMVILTIPFIYAVPLFGAHMIGGSVAGLVADRLG